MANNMKATGEVYLDTTSAQFALDKLNDKISKYDKQLKDTSRTLNERYAIEKDRADALAKADGIRQQIEKGLGATYNQQLKYVQDLRKEIKNVAAGTQEFADKLKNLEKATATLDSMDEKFRKVGVAQKGLLSDWKNIAAGVVIGNTVQAAIQTVGGYLSGIVSGNAKLSDSLSDIEKVSGLSAMQVKNLNSELSKIDTRTPTQELRNIAIGLGQVGEAVTAENVASIDKIVVALGDEFGGGAKEITTVLSTLRNNLEDIKTANYGEDIGNLGNALNVLGAEGLATAPVVTDFANRLAGVGGTFKLTSGEILGLSATMQELGINVERGSTATVKILQKIAAEPAKFAAVAGIPVKEFINLVNTDMAGAFNAVAVGAGKASGKNTEFAKILKDLDADGSGAGEVLSKLSKNQELLSQKTALATTALKTQSSITDEFNKKNTNLAAELEKLQKRLASLFANSTLSELFGGIVKGMNNIIQPTKTATQQFDDLNGKMNNLKNNILPLANRYDELKNKTNLSTIEQTEMNTIINSIAQSIPGAVTQFDKYGKAIAISTDRVKEFIATEQDRLKVVNKSAIEENEKSLKGIAQQIKRQKQDIDEIAATGTFKIFEASASGGGGTGSIRKANQQEIAEKQEKYRMLLAQQRGYEAEVKRLNGDTLKEQLAEVKKTETTTTTIVTEEEQKRKDKAAARAKEKADKEKAAAESLLQQLIDFDNDLKQRVETREKSEEMRVIEKYDKLIKEATKYAKRYAQFESVIQQLTKDKEAVITKLQADALAKRLKEAQENDKKIFSQEYAQAKENNTIYFDDKKAALTKSYVDGKLSKGQYNAAIKALERELLVEQIRIAEEYSKSVGGANIELFKLKKQLRDADLADAVKAKDAEVEAEVVKGDKKKPILEGQALVDIDRALQTAMAVTQIWDQFNQAQAEKENRKFEQEKKQNELRKKGIETLAKTGVISEVEKQKRLRDIDLEEDRKKEELERKQAERKRRNSIAQAIINGAQGVTRALAEFPFPFALVPIALAVATTAAQIATISSQKFAKGGLLNGPLHSQGGMPIINPRTGSVVAEVEGGEPILSRSTYANNKPLVDALLHSSMYRNGQTINPVYFERNYRPIDITGISNGFTQMRRYETGGILPGAANPNNTDLSALADKFEQNNMLQQMMLKQLETMSQQLNKPVPAVVSLAQLNDANDYKNQILQDAILQ